MRPNELQRYRVVPGTNCFYILDWSAPAPAAYVAKSLGDSEDAQMALETLAAKLNSHAALPPP